MPKQTIAKPRTGKNSLPDAATKKASDQTQDLADERILFFNTQILKFGIPDMNKAIALVLCLIILTFSFIVMSAGLFLTNTVWLDRIFSWLGNAFLFLAGFAIGDGKQTPSKSKDPTVY
ncbi:MAG: hypothetical protein EBY21_09990 [Alphaproteobacteria bacterium]|nr:hypothetical protein [Alphaproteobacteria bacterium]